MREDLPEGTVSLGKADCGCERVRIATREGREHVTALHDANCTRPGLNPPPPDTRQRRGRMTTRASRSKK